MAGARPRVCVIQFPGSNCEYETARALEPHGLEAAVLRWNSLDGSAARGFAAFVLPGGFSFQDRVRAGAVAAKERVMDVVAGAADSGVPVLGICNGAQILVESGLVPGWSGDCIDAALAHNISPGRTGYLSRWVHLRAAPGIRDRCPWLSVIDEPATVIPLPIAHAEGRFVFDRDRSSSDHTDSVAALTYCGYDGSPAGGYPDNPNGSLFDLAGITNRKGNVLAMMPHPERACWLWQVPPSLPGRWGEVRRAHNRRDSILAQWGPGATLFAGLAAFLGIPEAGAP